MHKLSKEQLENISGGISPWIFVGIGALVVFTLGFVDGVVHPKGCDA